MENTTKIGLIKFTNCLPVNFYLEKEKPNNTEYIYGTPAELNLLMAKGKIDLAPISAYEYIRNKANYSPIGSACISSNGECGSVLLFSKKNIKDLQGCKIGIPCDSATSIAMLKIILAQWGITPENTVFEQHTYLDGANSLLNSGFDAVLFIGDNALRKNNLHGNPCYVYDLGRLWKDLTGYPAVFGIFAARNEWINQNPELYKQFDNLINIAIATSLKLYFNEIINAAATQLGLQNEIAEDYLSAKISYLLTPCHEKSLQLLETLATKFVRKE
jgi:chorismate dehydratase